MRIGRFRVSQQYINSDVVLDMLKQVEVVSEGRVDYADFWEYVAIHPDFEDIEEDEEVPEYLAIANDDGFLGFESVSAWEEG